VAEAIQSIKLRGKIKEQIVKSSNKNPRLLDIDFAMASTNKFLELVRRYKRKVKYDAVYSDFKKWLKVQEKKFGV